MAEVIIMPKLGFNMDEGQLVKWCKNVGDKVAKGEALFDINTDKTVITVEATRDGVLLKTMLDEGGFAAVFTPIAVIGDEGEDPDAAIAAHMGGGAAPAEVSSSPADEGKQAPITPITASKAPNDEVNKLKLTPKAKKLVRDEGIDPASLTEIKGTGFQDGITANDIKASPLARKLADKTGVDLDYVEGTGVGGKIMKADVAAAASSISTTGSGDKVILKVIPYKGTRKIIGERLAQSKFTAPHLYFTDSIDMTAFNKFRKDLNTNSDQKIAVSDLLTLAATKCLIKYPDMNASLENEEIICYKSVNIGTAVAGEYGLTVPVIKNCEQKSLLQIAEEGRDLVERTKIGRISVEECSGGTFTISNLGMFGIENFTAIINPPEAAILSISSQRKKPIVIANAEGEDKVAIRSIMNIQLTVDHRIIDGLLAAQFIGYFKELMENPIRMLM